jgi:short-subunit dehydrogenase
METETKTVLITGATGGIGYELSKLFAREHYRIVIVAAEAATLHNVSEVLKTLGASKVYPVCRNFSNERSAEEVYHEVQAAGIKLDILVLNTVTLQAGKFVDVPASRELEFLHQNIAAPLVLTKYFLKEMVAAGSGKILNVLPYSLYELGFQPAVASASKSFVLSFTDALIKELQSTPVEVMAMISGASKSSFYSREGMRTVECSIDEGDDPAHIAKVAFCQLVENPSEKNSRPSGPPDHQNNLQGMVL